MPIANRLSGVHFRGISSRFRFVLFAGYYPAFRPLSRHGMPVLRQVLDVTSSSLPRDHHVIISREHHFVYCPGIEFRSSMSVARHLMPVFRRVLRMTVRSLPIPHPFEPEQSHLCPFPEIVSWASIPPSRNTPADLPPSAALPSSSRLSPPSSCSDHNRR